jgi:hypothetical protein
MIYFVSPSGSDSNPGTLSEPFLTVSKGLSVLAAGDTVNIRAGNYATIIRESMLNSSGTESQPIVVQGYLSEEVIVHGILFLGTARPYVTFRRIIFDPLGGV